MIKFKASFDDGCALDMRVADMLEEAGFAKEDAVFYIPVHWMGVNNDHGDQPLSTAQLKDIDKRFTIGSHTMTHTMLTRIPFDNACYEISESKKRLEAFFGHEINDFCYPRGYANDEIRDEVRKYYKTARNTLVGNLNASPDPIWDTPTVHVAGKRRVEYENTTWIDEACNLLSGAMARSYAGEDIIYHLWGHSWEIERYDQWKNFAKLLYMIKEVRG